ncbi:MAG: hypothetical protein V5A28_14585 [Haloarculaceae archaeon]
MSVFGRDSLIAAYQTLPLAPSLARGTLRYLAAHRGETTDEVTEEAPGKVFHEERTGELARREQIPHTPYYGTVDATPLWVVLLGELRRWSGDADIVHELEAPLADALDWTDGARDRFGDDPFLYYGRSPDVGLRHKAWRDSPGSVQYPDGRNAEHPIASVEVQGYVYRALEEAATLYEDALGLARAERYGSAERLARSLLEACVRFDDYRIPELFCGFDDDIDPLTYPSSCVPQAWSAGAPFATLRASFGLDPNGRPPTGNRPTWLADTAVDPILEQWDFRDR